MVCFNKNFMAEEVCPACCEVGRTGTLVLRQINAKEAIYVCNDSLCPYPVGLSDKIVENPVPELQPDADQPEKNGTLNLTFFSPVAHYGLCTFL